MTTRIFVWEYISNLTCNYHSGGGLVVFAESFDEAKQYAIDNISTLNEDDFFESFYVDGQELIDRTKPIPVRVIDMDVQSGYMVFPDVGCC